MKKIILSIILISLNVQAKDFGVYGDLWPVQEENLLSVIESRLNTLDASGELKLLNNQFKERVYNNSIRPPYVNNLKNSIEDSFYYYDPTVKVPEDMKDHNGVIFAKKGSLINPLDHIPFNQTLIFFDGDNAIQKKYVKELIVDLDNYKIILTKGNIPETSKYMNERIYFDQNGNLTNKLRIKEIPAIVSLSEDKRHLKVNYVGLDK
ncbi:type-F conjugative transfer system protein TraW [Providencia sp. wls1919]|nr:type-F conjugative transfer system protein TraW [Providencia sp. wls1919]